MLGPGTFFTFFFIICANPISGSGDINIMRGVELKFQPFYAPKKDFTCLDSSRSIPFSSVNDDYCDCADGSDEPGTSACPGGRYYCYNIGYRPKYIPSSRVNDDICDCCDGSDEFDSTVACMNECQKYGHAEQQLRKEEMEETIEGAKVREEYMQAGKEIKETKMQRMKTIDELLDVRKKELDVARTAKEQIEAPEKEAKDKHQKEWDDKVAAKKALKDAGERNEAFDFLDMDKDGWVSIPELTSNMHLENDLTEEEAKTMLGEQTMVDRESIVSVWKNIKPKFKKQGRPDPTKFDESDREEPPSPPEKPDNDKKEEEEEQMPEYDNAVKLLIAEADIRRDEFNKIDQNVRELEKEKRGLDEYLKIDFGANEEFSALKGQCYELTDREYTYKLCPFEKVTQKNKDGGPETDLGNKMSWVDTERGKYATMKYEGGQTCWNGPARSTIVHMACGKENKLLTVTEPSRCEYEIGFKTPCLCVNNANHDEL